MQVLTPVPLNYLAVANDGPPNSLLLVCLSVAHLLWKSKSCEFCVVTLLCISVSSFALGALMPSVVSKYFF